SAALAAAQAATQTPSPAAPSGPPLSAGEKDALRVAVSSCWNVGSLSTEALGTTVVVTVTMTEDARPVNASIRMTGFSGGSEGAARQAFEAARRAIIRCGANGFALPVEKFDQWREIEMTFNPESMRIR
ncbi:MAG: energy transducer TonB, partial [Rhodobacteraceae bacterium]